MGATNPLRMIIEAVRGVGLTNALAAPKYDWVKSRLERTGEGDRTRRGRTGTAAEETTPGRPLSIEPRKRGARLVFEHAALDISVLAPDLFRLSWEPRSDTTSGAAPAAAATPPLPYALARDDRDWPAATFAVEADEGSWRVGTDQAAIRVDRPSGVVELLDPSGRVLRREQPPRWSGAVVTHQCGLHPGARLYGLGEKAAPLDLRGGAYRLWNRDPGGAYGPGKDPIYMGIPVYTALHSAGAYLVFYENHWPAVFDLGRTQPDLADHAFEGGALVHYLIPGPAARAIERYTELTGRAPLPPLWALGYHQSRWSYYPAERVRRLAADFERYDVPVDAIHLDIDYMDGFRVFTWDHRRFPDLPGLAEELRGKGINLVAILDPGVKRDPGYEVYRQGLAGGRFIRRPSGADRADAPVLAPVWPGWCAFPDFTDPAVREWWGEHYPTLLEAGIAGFWHDMNEPATFVAVGDPTLPHSARHSMEGRGGTHREAHNVYGLLMNRAGHEALRKHRPGRRPFILSRSGWAGVQRYAWNWTGDVTSNWASLRQVVATVIGLGLSGQPFAGSDIGGFSGATTPELFTRWLQLGVFLPLCRAHTAKTTADQEPWSFGEPYLSINREFIRLRYSLLPYLYTAAWQAHERGWPMVRPVFWGMSAGSAERAAAAGVSAAAAGTTTAAEDLLAVDDAFLLGDHLLVAPVLDQGARSRDVVLPPGGWYDWWEGKLVSGPGQGAPGQGPARVAVEAPLERMPLFVRAGAVIPAEPPARNTAARRLDQLDLHVWVPAGGDQVASFLYADAGDGYGPSRLDRFVVAREPGRV
ncbi:MAG TPA: TIM-barrel domain-containing protein, partial [Bacillota bacterium]